MKNKESQRGDVLVGLLIGLFVGGAMLYIQAGNYAQKIANETGQPVPNSALLADQPGESLIKVVAPAAAGAGIGWVLDQLGKEDRKSRDINIHHIDDSVITVDTGNSDDDTTVNTETSTSGNNYGGQ